MHMISFLVPSIFLATGPVEFVSSGFVTDLQGKPIDVGTYAAPLLTDWDGDGLNDLLAGQFEEGRMRLYKGSGTPSEPVFDDFQYLRDGGGILSVPYG